MSVTKSHKPIEVLGIGCAACEATTPHFEVRATEEAIRQVYEVTGVKPEEIDIFYANDFIITSHLVAAEIAGYLPYGEGWKYICEGRTAYDGDKPIKLHSIVMPAPLSNKPEYKAMGKFAYGEVELEEGSRLNAVVRGINKKKRKEILEAGKLPVPVKAAIYQRDGFKTVVFDLVEE